MTATPEQIRETLLKSARAAGERYLRVRGVDLEAALSGAAPAPLVRQPALASRKPNESKDE